MATEKWMIDANAIPWEEYYVPDPDSNVQWDFKKEFSVLKSVVDQMPTVDAVEVVRCKDCIFCHYNSSNETYKCITMNGMYRTVEPNEFCAYGERKIDDLRA